MSNKHPSGRPIRRVRKGIAPATYWPRDEHVVPFLNRPRRDLGEHFGFGIPAEPEDHMWLETRTKR